MKQKLSPREKANAMEPITKTIHFTDKAVVPGSCQVQLPANRFSYIISKRVAENLLNTYGNDLVFDLWRPLGVCEEDSWVEIKPDHLVNRKLPDSWTIIEIWMPSPVDDIPDNLFRSSKV